tara:strand:- start:378 stop:1391 length:1014 start_codon:yes stop_codon:yes gene_type:complete
MNLKFIKKKNTLSFLVTHVPQESETIFPIINELNKAKKKIFVVFYRKELFDYYCKNKIFKIIKNQNNVKILFLKNRIYKLIGSIYIFFKSDEIFLGDGIKNNYKTFFSKLNIFFRKEFFIFRHSTGTLIKNNHFLRFKENVEFNKKLINLVSTEKCKEMLILNGYKKVFVIGEVYCDKNYLKLADSNTQKLRDYILLFSYKSNLSWFKYFDKVEHYKAITQLLNKHYKKKTLIIKPHPSENVSEIRKILMLLKFYNFKIVSENSISLAINASLVISLNTSAGLMSFKNKIPTVNLCFATSAKKEERLEKSKNVSFLEGIPSVYNNQEFEFFLINLKN